MSTTNEGTTVRFFRPGEVLLAAKRIATGTKPPDKPPKLPDNGGRRVKDDPSKIPASGDRRKGGDRRSE